MLYFTGIPIAYALFAAALTYFGFIDTTTMPYQLCIRDRDRLKGFRTYTTAADAAAAEGKVDVIIYMTKATQLEQRCV